MILEALHIVIVWQTVGSILAALSVLPGPYERGIIYWTTAGYRVLQTAPLIKLFLAENWYTWSISYLALMFACLSDRLRFVITAQFSRGSHCKRPSDLW